jgi:hypothetical protein
MNGLTAAPTVLFRTFHDSSSSRYNHDTGFSSRLQSQYDREFDCNALEAHVEKRRVPTPYSSTTCDPWWSLNIALLSHDEGLHNIHIAIIDVAKALQNGANVYQARQIAGSLQAPRCDQQGIPILPSADPSIRYLPKRLYESHRCNLSFQFGSFKCVRRWQRSEIFQASARLSARSSGLIGTASTTANLEPRARRSRILYFGVRPGAPK